MKNKILFVIDMQRDFIDGSLGSPEAQAIVPAVKAKIDEYISNGGRVIYTKDTHGEYYHKTLEGKNLPIPHCIKGTAGWEIPDDIYREGCRVIHKNTFGFDGWNRDEMDADKKALLEADSFELCGLCTDICVVSNALLLKAKYPWIPIKVDSKCCAGVTPDSHEAALTVMKMCQIEII